MFFGRNIAIIKHTDGYYKPYIFGISHYSLDQSSDPLSNLLCDYQDKMFLFPYFENLELDVMKFSNYGNTTAFLLENNNILVFGSTTYYETLNIHNILPLTITHDITIKNIDIYLDRSHTELSVLDINNTITRFKLFDESIPNKYSKISTINLKYDVVNIDFIYNGQYLENFLLKVNSKENYDLYLLNLHNNNISLIKQNIIDYTFCIHDRVRKLLFIDEYNNIIDRNSNIYNYYGQKFAQYLNLDTEYVFVIDNGIAFGLNNTVKIEITNVYIENMYVDYCYYKCQPHRFIISTQNCNLCIFNSENNGFTELRNLSGEFPVLKSTNKPNVKSSLSTTTKFLLS